MSYAKISAIICGVIWLVTAILFALGSVFPN